VFKVFDVPTAYITFIFGARVTLVGLGGAALGSVRGRHRSKMRSGEDSHVLMILLSTRYGQ
jgi:hypothetical protein